MTNRNTGDYNTGYYNTGYYNTGNWNTGNWSTGNWNTGDRNTGDHNTGDQNTGDWNTGGYNTGHRNTGNWNTGDQNTGYRNTGYRNTGNWNTGSWNTGGWNTGDGNTGDWNTGDQNTGCFNTITPEGGYFFNKWLTFEEWRKADKPDWIYKPNPTTWVEESQMSEEEKAANPSFSTCGGYLRKNDMREEWRKAYESATEEEIQMVRDLPNFDADVFEAITGLNLRVNTDSCEGKIVEIDGKKYKLKEV
jgi:hypothetical protein